MADNTKIEWADATVNAINGCTVKSPGCANCYAMKQAHRFDARRGLTSMTNGGMVWTGEVRLNEKQLLQPLSWKRPRGIFWNAHGDPFHPKVPDEWIDKMFGIAALTPQHTHMILTKRSDRMRQYVRSLPNRDDLVREAIRASGVTQMSARAAGIAVRFTLPNVWLGVSVEDQARADERIPDLIDTPAAVRFLSCEPLLGPVDLTVFPVYDKPLLRGDVLLGIASCGPLEVDCPKLDWVIVGGESGPGARPMHPDWARSIRDQCAAADVPFHFKQWGEWYPAFANDSAVNSASVRETREIDGAVVHRLGKKTAGRLLDGVQHDGMPA